jgi:hypothetical protein
MEIDVSVTEKNKRVSLLQHNNTLLKPLTGMVTACANRYHWQNRGDRKRCETKINDNTKPTW